jgi:hypothetical protein
MLKKEAYGGIRFVLKAGVIFLKEKGQPVKIALSCCKILIFSSRGETTRTSDLSPPRREL